MTSLHSTVGLTLMSHPPGIGCRVRAAPDEGPDGADPPARAALMPSQLGPQHLRTIVLAGMVGNMMEWYDFGLYGVFAA